MIYFVQMPDAGPIKIGHTTNVRNRLSQLQVSMPQSLTLLGIRDGGVETEKKLHRRLESERLSGEWFKPSPLVLATIQEDCHPLPKPRRKRKRVPFDKLAAAIDEAGFTRIEFAAQAGISQSYLSLILGRRKGVTLATAARIKALTGHRVSFEDFLDEAA